MFQPIFKGKARAVGSADNQIPNAQPSDLNVVMQHTTNKPATSAESTPSISIDSMQVVQENGNSDQRLKAKLEILLKVILVLLEDLLFLTFSCRP